MPNENLTKSTNAHAGIARAIQSFLWTGKPNQSEPINRSNQELRDYLESIRKQAWRHYYTGQKHNN